MDLPREADPKPLPPEATGAVVEKKKVKVLVLAALAIGLVIASFIAWLFRPRTVPSGRQMTSSIPVGNQTKKTPALSESAEEEYEKGYKKGLRSNPAFNVGDGAAGAKSIGAVKPNGENVSATKKRTPKEAYDDLLADAAVADSTVKGEQHERRDQRERRDSAAEQNSRDSDLGRPPLLVNPVPISGPGDDPNADHRNSANRKGMEAIPAGAIPAGTFISGTLANELNGENVGPVKVQVSNDVYHPLTFDLLISQGSIFLGEAQRVSSQFQQRLAVSFDHLQFVRDGKLYEVQLNKIPGLDQRGATALKGKVDNHYLQIFGASLAIGAIGGLAQIGGGSYGGYGGYDWESQARSGITQTMAQNASQILNRFLNRLPTVVVPPGTPVVVYVPFGIELQ